MSIVFHIDAALLNISPSSCTNAYIPEAQHFVPCLKAKYLLLDVGL